MNAKDTIMRESIVEASQEKKKTVSFVPLLQTDPPKPLETDNSTDPYLESARNLATEEPESAREILEEEPKIVKQLSLVRDVFDLNFEEQ